MERHKISDGHFQRIFFMRYLSVAVFDFFQISQLNQTCRVLKDTDYGTGGGLETSRIKYDSLGTTGFDGVLLWQDVTEEAGRAAY